MPHERRRTLSRRFQAVRGTTGVVATLSPPEIEKCTHVLLLLGYVSIIIPIVAHHGADFAFCFHWQYYCQYIGINIIMVIYHHHYP